MTAFRESGRDRGGPSRPASGMTYEVGRSGEMFGELLFNVSKMLCVRLVKAG